MHRGFSSVLPAMSRAYAPIMPTLPDGRKYTPSISSADSAAQSLMQRSSMRFRLLSISPAMNGCAVNPIILPTANTMPIS